MPNMVETEHLPLYNEALAWAIFNAEGNRSNKSK
jgi:hypothetical protein